MSKKVRLYLIIFVSFSIIFGVLLLKTNAQPFYKDKVIATVNNEEIYESELKIAMKSATPMLSNQESKEIEDTTINKQIELKALEKLIHKELILQEAKKEKFTLPPNQATNAIEQLEESFKTEKEFKQVLHKYNLSENELKEKVQEELIVTTFLEKKLGKPMEDGTSKEGQQQLESFLNELKKKNKIDIHL